MDALTEKDRLDYAWKYFALIADQRIKTFNFYIIVLIASFGGTLSAISQSFSAQIWILLGVAHMIVALIFWLIDVRSCKMLDISSNALVEIEESDSFKGKRTLLLEDRKMHKIGCSKLLSYRYIFLATFCIQGAFGLLIIFSMLFKMSKFWFCQLQ